LGASTAGGGPFGDGTGAPGLGAGPGRGAGPGADRPLTSGKDFRRSLGRRLQLDIRDPDGKVRTRYGALIACGQGSITLQSEQGTAAIKLEDVMRARIELSFK
jgi:ribosome maturation factor RimP